MPNVGGKTRCIMGDMQMANGLKEEGGGCGGEGGGGGGVRGGRDEAWDQETMLQSGHTCVVVSG